MRRCNKCENKRPEWMFKTSKKKTCRKCEYRWWREILRLMVRDRKLTPTERLATRIGYMGVGFLIAGQWTISPPLYMIGFCCVLVQVSARKQWNLVALQLNGLIAWTIHFINSL
jgi:hypothetical protein